MALRIGRYLLHDQIASGGMASVHFGRLVGTGGFAKTVAIKRLLPQLARQEAFRTMILAEARLASRIRHPNVVPPLDVLAEGSELLLVMEYVHGEALSKLMRAARGGGERVPVAVAAGILSNVLHGLHAAHEARGENGEPLAIVHRDVSPQNIIVGTDGVARVIDFGIAKAVTSGETTNTGTVKGKLPYLSTEQLEGEPVTRRTDVYAAGIVLWEVLVGRRLFEGSDDSVVLRKIMSYEPPPPSQHNPAVPGALDEIVLKALAKKPLDRYGTAREMALAIEEAVVIATPSVVGAWCERLAEETLSNRAATIARLEASDPEEVEVSPASRAPASIPPPSRAPASIPPSAPASSQKTTKPPPSRVAAAVAPPLPPPPPPRVPSFADGVPPSARGAVPSPPPPSARAPSPKPASLPPPPPPPPRRSSPEVGHGLGGEPFGGSALDVVPDTRRGETRPLTVSVHDGSERAAHELTPVVDLVAPVPAGALPALPRPAMISMQGTTEPTESSRKAWIIFLGLALFIALAVGTPMILARIYVAVAARHGVTLSVERVEVSRRSLRLVEVHASSPELPGAAVTARSVTLGGLFSPKAITIEDAVVELDGRATDLVDRVTAFRGARAAGLQSLFASVERVALTSGSVVWKDAVAEGTSLQAENVTLDAPRVAGRALFDDVQATLPLVTLRTGDAVLAGPWLLEVERKPPLSRVLWRFDPQGSSVGRISLSFSDDGAATVSFAVPPSSLSELRLPAAALGPAFGPAARVELAGELSLVASSPAAGGQPVDLRVPGSRAASGRFVVVVARATPFAGSAPVDLSLDVTASGDPAKPVPLGATLALGPTDPGGRRAVTTASARLAGELDTTAVVPHFVLKGTSPPFPCVPSEPSGTALGVDLDLAFDRLRTSTFVLAATSPCVPKLR